MGDWDFMEISWKFHGNFMEVYWVRHQFFTSPFVPWIPWPYRPCWRLEGGGLRDTTFEKTGDL